jgi:hypothetical protein
VVSGGDVGVKPAPLVVKFLLIWWASVQLFVFRSHCCPVPTKNKVLPLLFAGAPLLRVSHGVG